MEFFLHGQQIPTDGSGLVNITNIGNNDNDALICQSEKTFSSKSGNWYLIADDQMNTNINEANIINSGNPRGWKRNRGMDSAGHRLVRLRRRSSTATVGRFTCHIRNDYHTPRALRIFYPSESFQSID